MIKGVGQADMSTYNTDIPIAIADISIASSDNKAFNAGSLEAIRNHFLLSVRMFYIPERFRDPRTVRLTKNIYYFFEQNRINCT